MDCPRLVDTVGGGIEVVAVVEVGAAAVVVFVEGVVGVVGGCTVDWVGPDIKMIDLKTPVCSTICQSL